MGQKRHNRLGVSPIVSVYLCGKRRNMLEYKTSAASLEIKAEGEALTIRAYVLAFNNIDSYGDVILPGACDAFLAGENAKRMRLCYQHKMDEVIGVIRDKGVDEKGMWIEADVLDTPTGKDVQKLLKAGAIDEFSIGYIPVKFSYGERDEKEVRFLEEINIWEASPVTRAANPRAVLIDAKSEIDSLDFVSELSDDALAELKKKTDTEYVSRIIEKL